MKIFNNINFIGFKKFDYKKETPKPSSVSNANANYTDYAEALSSINKAMIAFGSKEHKKPNKAEMLEYFDEGKDEQEIADIMGLTKQEVHKYLRRWGIISTKSIYEANQDLIFDLLNSGKTCGEVADIIGCSKTSIVRCAKLLGFKRKNLAEENKELIIELYKSGMTQKEIAKFIGISQAVVSDSLIHWDIDHKPTIEENHKDTIIEMYQKGMSQQGIADVLNCSPQSIKNILVKNNVELRVKPTIETSKEKIIELYNQGKSVNEIAKMFGYQPQSLYPKFREWGLSLQKKAPRGTTEIYKDEILKMRESNCSYREIADTLGVALSTIEHAIIRWTTGEESRTANKNSTTEINKDRIIELYQDGYSRQKIADIIECDRSIIVHALKRWGFETRGNIAERNRDKILELHRLGVSTSNIAKEIGCSRSTIVKAFNDWGIRN